MSQADLTKFIGNGVSTGSKANIWVQILFFINVGSGQWTNVASNQISFAGKIDTVFYKGNLSLQLSLVDGTNANVVVNGAHASHATYKVSGNAITFDAKFSNGKSEKVVVKQGGSGNKETYLELSGSYQYNVHLT